MTTPTDLERALLAHIILDKDGFSNAAQAGVSAQTFTERNHILAWLVACRVVESGQPLAMETLADEAGRHRWIDLMDQALGKGAGQRSGPADPADSVLALWGGWAAVGDLFSVRGMVRATIIPQALAAQRTREAASAIRGALDALARPDGVTQRDGIVARLLDRLMAQGPGGGSTTIGTAAGDALVAHDAAKEAGGLVRASWGVPSLDHALPLAAGRMIVLAGNPGGGKTSLAIAAALATARITPGSAAIVSLEMTPADLAARLIAAQVGVGDEAILAGWLTPEQRTKADEAKTALDRNAIPVQRPGDATLPAVLSWIRAVHQRAGGSLRLVVIDYLQRITWGPKQTEYAALSQASQAIANLAVQLPGLCILLLSQYNRAGRTETRGKGGEVEASPEPRLADLRGSGSIEQDAAGVLGLWLPKPSASAHVVITGCVLKHKYGQPGGKLPLAWDRAHGGTWADHIEPVPTGRTPEEIQERRERMRAAPSEEEDVFSDHHEPAPPVEKGCRS